MSKETPTADALIKTRFGYGHYNLTKENCIFLMELYVDACLNEYLNATLCTKSIPMPKADSNSIAESINKYLNK